MAEAVTHEIRRSLQHELYSKLKLLDLDIVFVSYNSVYVCITLSRIFRFSTLLLVPDLRR